MGAVQMWGWSPDDEKWVKLQLDSDGSIHVVGYVDNLSDIGDVTVVGIAGGMGIYWDAATSTWKVKQFLPLAGGTLTGNLIMNAGGLKIILADDAVIQIGTLDGSEELKMGKVTDPWEATFQPKDGNTIGEIGVLPKGTEDSSVLSLHNAEDHDNCGFLQLVINGLIASLQTTKVGTGTAPTSLLLQYDTLPWTSIGYGLGNATHWWKHIKAQYYHLLSALATDHIWTGMVTVDITAGENLVFGDAVYMKSDGKAWKSDADGAATMPIFGIAVATINAEAAGEILVQGWIRDDSFSLIAGGIVYASVTAGGISGTAPVGSGDQVQVIGIAKTTALFYFNPSYELVEIS